MAPPRSSKSTGPVAPTPSKEDITPAVLATETVHVNVDSRLPSTPKQGSQANNAGALPQSSISPGNVNKTSQPAVIDIPKQSVNVVQPIQSMRTIELSTGRVREGFGKHIFLIFSEHCNFVYIDSSKRRCDRYTVTNKYSLALDNSCCIPPRACSRRIDGTRINGEFSFR